MSPDVRPRRDRVGKVFRFEAGIPYEQKLIDHKQKMSGDYLALQSFGQVPAIEHDGVRLFESGAIIVPPAALRVRVFPG